MAWKLDGQYDFAIPRATKSSVSAFGIDFACEGGSAFASPFSWAA